MRAPKTGMFSGASPINAPKCLSVVDGRGTLECCQLSNEKKPVAATCVDRAEPQRPTHVTLSGRDGARRGAFSSRARGGQVGSACEVPGRRGWRWGGGAGTRLPGAGFTLALAMPRGRPLRDPSSSHSALKPRFCVRVVRQRVFF